MLTVWLTSTGWLHARRPVAAIDPSDPGRACARCATPTARRPRSSPPPTQEFARHGLGGARVDRIAARAKTNKRMLYYYFGNKEALFRAVLEGAYARIRAAEQELAAARTSRRPKACAGWSSSRGAITSPIPSS